MPPIKKKRVVKLNSSDSSESSDEEEDKRPAKRKKLTKRLEIPSVVSLSSDRIEGGTNSRPAASSPKTNPGLVESLPTNRTVSLERPSELQNREKDPKQAKENESARTRDPDSPSDDVRDSKIDYATDEEFEKEFTKFGFERAGPIQNFINQESQGMRVSNRKNDELNDTILDLNPTKLQLLLNEKGPMQSFHEICLKHSLHEMLTRTYLSMGQLTQYGGIKDRQRDTEHIIRIAIAHIPLDILRVQNDELNTLLHCAINAENYNIVQFLINMGSPLHIRNKYGMTAVESCLVTKQHRLLELVLKHGGTFHHVLNKNPLEGTDHYPLHGNLAKASVTERRALLDVVNVIYAGINEASRHVRLTLIASRLQEFEHGPIVCFPRGNLPNDGNQQTIQFTIPNQWVDMKNGKYMLVIIPMAYHRLKKKFFGYPRAPLMKTPPKLCGVECEPMSNTEQTIFYRATKSLETHINGVTELKLDPPKIPEINRHSTREERDRAIIRSICTPFDPTVCTISLDIDSIEVFSFIACQVIRFKPINKTIRSIATGNNARTNFAPNKPDTIQRGSIFNNKEPSSSRNIGHPASDHKF
uniref:ANK_REP_REGION domain-containing protein n=1 Tax=Caenorhabditis tropicalis TaxID=1561998 RepID=A0A1I7T0Z4_9PELO